MEPGLPGLACISSSLCLNDPEGIRKPALLYLDPNILWRKMGLLSFSLGYLLAVLLNLFIREIHPGHGIFCLGKNCGERMSS